ncbi:MAG: sel1 repeat family protein [Nitrospira sp.]|nr:sel1 repeat family protein [Nitrospira sp.]
MTGRTFFPACIMVGVLLLTGCITWTQPTSRSNSRLPVRGGTPTACNGLGLLYMKGEGVKQDEARAAAMFRKACDVGDPNSCSNLGVLYAEGTGVPQDDVQAVVFSRKACDGGDARGCYNLGVMYAEGTGVQQDDVQASDFTRKACDSGNMKGLLQSGRDVCPPEPGCNRMRCRRPISTKRSVERERERVLQSCRDVCRWS